MCRKMDLFLTSCLMFFSNSLLTVFRFITLHVLRSVDLKSTPLDAVKKAQHKDGMEEIEDTGFPWFSFMFHYQICKHEETPVTAVEENQTSLTFPDMRSFWPEIDFNGCMEEPKAMNYQVHESYFQLEECGFDGDEDIRYVSTEDLERSNEKNILGLAQLEKQAFEEESFNYVLSETSSVGEKGDSFIMEVFSGLDKDIGLFIGSDYDNFKYDGYHSDSEHDSKIRETLKRKNIELVESNEAKEDEQEENYERRKETKNEEPPFPKNGTERLDNIEGTDSEPKSESSGRDETGRSPNNDLSVPSYVSYEKQHTIDYNDDQKQLPKLEVRSKEICSYDLHEEELDEMWEHQDLIDQLTMELRKVRAVGLPTILEESENSKEFEDPKPLKINDNFLHENLLDELHKFYKCYDDRMRKFDSLNYQKMYATVTGFLHLNDPLELRKTLRPMLSTIIYRAFRNFLPICIKKSGRDPSEKFIKKLRCDLETIYVGQTCLSWEYLRWQYEKLHELSDFGSVINHHYNNVAAEFQQFKVTLQRFVENEPFQGPRIANYAKQRCILRNFIQIPVVKVDSLMDEVERRKDEDVITKERLEEIMEEAMRVWWEFFRAETYETPGFLKGLVLENLAELLDPSDHEFMVDIRANLQKKEKKLKDLLKAGNCIVKKLKRRQEYISKQELFFSQVDLKLVSRVLNMSMITSDQLIWCHKKLSKISFSGRKLHREPSILLFPC